MTTEPASKRTQGTIIAFDFGTQFIGVAIGNRLIGTATPLPHLLARDGVPDWQLIGSLLDDWQPEAAVIGLPLNMDGSESAMAQRARKFANRVHGRFGIQVHCQDERLSSFEAKQRIPRGKKKPQGGGAVDSLAASVILEHWLTEQENH